MQKSKDKKILVAMGITAICLVIIVLCIAVTFTTEGIMSIRVLVPIVIGICSVAASAGVLLFVLKSSGNK